MDSGSTDSTISIAKRYPVKIVSIKPEDFSFGASLNMGCKVAQGEFIVIASAHVYPVYKNWLEKLIAPFSNPKVGIVYGKQRGNESTKFSEHQIFQKWFPDRGDPQQDHPFCNNANAVIRRALWEKWHYDEALSGLEDLAWAKRIVAEGFSICYEADAEIIHVHNETMANIYNRYQREAVALKCIYPEEHFGFFHFIFLFLGTVSSDCLHAVREYKLCKNFASIIGFRLMQFWGTYSGFQKRGDVSAKLKRKFYYPRGFSIAEQPRKSFPEKSQKIVYSSNGR